MKIIILSDTHIKKGQSLISHLPEELVYIIKSCDLIIHAGDFETVECFNELLSLSKLEAVHGDTDCAQLMELLPERKVIKIDGIKIGVIHKGQLTSENNDGLRYLAKEMDVDVLIFGHFHHPIVHVTEVLLLSPGSATIPGITQPSAMELNISGKSVKGRIIRCKDNGCTYFEYESGISLTKRG